MSAGVIYSTDDLTSRAFTIPDGTTTKYLYAAVADDCGEPVDWSTDPIQRKLTVAMTLEDSKTESTPSKMLILKAVKATAGETPTVTLYANEGLPNGLTGAILPWSDSIAYTQGRSVIGSDHRIYRSRITDNLNNNPHGRRVGGQLELLTRDHVTEAQATISGGVAHVSGFFNRLLPEGDAADTLDYLSIGNLADGHYVIIRNADAAHTITVTHGAGGPGQILDPDEGRSRPGRRGQAAGLPPGGDRHPGRLQVGLGLGRPDRHRRFERMVLRRRIGWGSSSHCESNDTGGGVG